MVDTGRMACRNPNLQNIPSKGGWAKIREAFVAAPGHRLIVADYSQMELRILAQLSQEPKMIQAFRDGTDLHSQTAEALFGPEFTKEQRQIAKTFNFAVCYGSGPGTLAQQADIPYLQAKALLAKYFQTYPMLKEFLDRSSRHAQDYCYSETPAGRKRWYNRPDPTAENYKQQLGAIGREGCNAPIQGCNADCTKIASALFERAVSDCLPRGRILMWVHDEIVVESPEETAELDADLLKHCMIEAGERYLTDVPVEVSIAIGDRWQK
jgi:DNA polymerase I